MRRTVCILAMVGLIGGCATDRLRSGAAYPVTLQVFDRTDPEYQKRLDAYFTGFCDCTGNAGIYHVAWHKFSYEFRQRLKTTQDQELKRLFVLSHLYNGLEWEIEYYERGVIGIPTKEGGLRRMTPEERKAARTSLVRRLSDLSSFDPEDLCGDIREVKERLESIP